MTSRGLLFTAGVLLVSLAGWGAGWLINQQEVAEAFVVCAPMAFAGLVAMVAAVRGRP